MYLPLVPVCLSQITPCILLVHPFSWQTFIFKLYLGKILSEGPQYINGQIISGCLLENAQSQQTDGLTSSLDGALAFRLWVHSLSPTWSSKQNEFGGLISGTLAQSHYAYFSRGLTIYSISLCFEGGPLQFTCSLDIPRDLMKEIPTCCRLIIAVQQCERSLCY